MSIVQTIHVSVDQYKLPAAIHAVQNDSGRTIKMVVDDLTLVNTMTGKLSFRRASGTYYELAATIDTTTNSFSAELDQALTSPGTTHCQLKVTDSNDDLVSSFDFDVFVEEDRSGTITPEEGISISQAVQDAEDAADRAEAAAETLELDATLTSATKAAQGKVTGDNLRNIMSVRIPITSFSSPSGNYIYTNVNVGSTVNLTPNYTSSHTWRYAIVPCSEGESVELHITGGASPRAWAFLDADNKLLSRATTNGAFNTTVTAPANTAKVVLNDDSNGSAFLLSVPGRIEVLENAVNGNIGLDNFDSMLKGAFSYGYENETLTVVSNYYISTTGEVTSNTGSSYTSLSVTKGQHYKIKARHGSDMKMYVLVDSANNVVEYYPTSSVSTVTETKEIAIPTNGTLYVNSYSASDVLRVGIATSITAEKQPLVNGWYLFGDSWCAPADGMKKWCDYVAEETHASLNNMAVSGTGYKHGNSYYGTRINSKLPSNFDGIITIFGSGNDCQYMGSYAGTSSDIYNPGDGTGDTVGGRINYAFSIIKSKAPLAKVMILSPCPWGIYPLTTANNAMEQYVDLLKECTLKAGFIFIDMYHNSGLRPWDDTQASLWQEVSPSNRVHPTNDGHYFLYPQMSAEIKKIMPTLDKYVAT